MLRTAWILPKKPKRCLPDRSEYRSLDSDKRSSQCGSIVKDGEVTGILRGVIDLDELQSVWNINLYGVRADIYIVERSSGDYIVDTSGNKLGNVKFIDNKSIIKRSSMDELARQLMRGKKRVCCI